MLIEEKLKKVINSPKLDESFQYILEQILNESKKLEQKIDFFAQGSIEKDYIVEDGYITRIGTVYYGKVSLTDFLNLVEDQNLYYFD